MSAAVGTELRSGKLLTHNCVLILDETCKGLALKGLEFRGTVLPYVVFIMTLDLWPLGITLAQWLPGKFVRNPGAVVNSAATSHALSFGRQVGVSVATLPRSCLYLECTRSHAW